jgi:predicted acetyltransferase
VTAEPVAVSLQLVTAEHHQVLERLWQLYRHDLSEFRGTLPDESGVYKRHRLATHLADPDAVSFLLRHGTGLAGFALVGGLSQPVRTIDEFFVVRAARRAGVGAQAVACLLALYPGQWRVAFQDENAAAARFWRRVAAGAAESAQERRPVPGKPQLPPDVWLTFATTAAGSSS